MTLLFGILNTSAVQDYARKQIEAQLKAKLHVNLGIGTLHFQPFNTIELNNIYINDQKDSTIFKAKKIYANLDLLDLLQQQIIVNTVRLSDFDTHLSKESKQSPLNIQFILDAFKANSKSKKTKFDVKLTAITMSNGNFSFDIKDQEVKNKKFDPNHINVSKLNIRLALKSLKSDSLNVQIRSLSLQEKSGFKISNLVTRFITQGKKVSIKDFALDLPKSLLKLDSCEIDLTHVTSSMDLFEHATFRCSTSSSYIALKDISAFVPIFANFGDRIYLKTRINGSLDDLKMPNLSLDYGFLMHLKANAEVKNIRYKNRMYILGQIEEFSITKGGIEGLLNNFSKNKKTIPPQIANLGKVSFKGNLSGYLTQLKAFGNFNTDLGPVTTDLLFGFQPNDNVDAYFNGKIATPLFNLGKLTGQKDLNKLSFDLIINILKPKNGKLGGKVEGKIHELDYKSYPYKDLTLDGTYNGLNLEGKLLLNDPNVNLKIDGLADLSSKNPILNFTAHIQNLRMDKLNISQKYPDSFLSFNIDANFVGRNIDNADGTLDIDSLQFIRPDKHLFINKLAIETSGIAANRKLKIESDIINGEILGAYSFSTMLASLKNTANLYLPALINSKNLKNKKIDTNNLSLDFTIKNTQEFTDIFNLPITIVEPLRIIGFYNNIQNKFKLEVSSPSLKAGKTSIKSLDFVADNDANQINSKISLVTTAHNGSLNNLLVDLSAKQNVVDTKISFENTGLKILKASLLASTTFEKKENTPLKAKIEILPSQLNLNDTIWTVNKSQINIDSSFVAVNNFLINSVEGQQSIRINGDLSRKDPTDILRVNLENMDLTYIFDLLNIPALNFGGYASGSLAASSVEGKLYTNVNLGVRDFAFNNTQLGDLTLASYFDDKTNQVNMKGEILSDEMRKTEVNGFINPVTQKLSIDFDADRINIGFLNKYVSTLFNHISGRGSGHVRLFGDTKLVTVEGKAFIDQGKLGINTLNADYTFSDTIFMKKDLIYFNNIKFNDKSGHSASVSGKVVHDFFTNFLYQINFKGDNFLVYNATKQQNQTFNGTVYATGSGDISGDDHSLNITAHIKTDKKTKIFMDFMEDAATNYSFITYKSPKDTVTNAEDADKNSNSTNPGGKMKIGMNFYVDATPDATVEMLMDPIGGDEIKGIGSGSLQFLWGTDSDPRLFGTYTINRGSYNFTFQKILERIFSIEDGSSVQFRGDPFGATLNMNAVYHLTANLNDLDKDLVTNSGQSNVPVNCLMNITGELKHPSVKLDVQLPNADPEIQRQAKSIMEMDDQINRQVVYLLLLSKFYTPNYGYTDNTTNSFASVASATLSTQLGNLLNQIDPRFQVGTNIRTSDAQFTATEVELILSSHLLNDRLILNGNFGYREDPNLPSSFIGDVDAEYLLSNSGNWRIKAYNHSNEKYYLLPNPTGRAIQTQGIGIKYKKDFDKIGDLFNWNSKPASSTKNPPPIYPDSTHIGSPLGSFIKIK